MLEELTSLTNLLIIASIILNMIIIIMISKNKSSVRQNSGDPIQNTNTTSKQIQGMEVGVVFCRTCGNQYDSTDKSCPNCKTTRV
ncbi:hypothetical protein [Ornithinibacillus sp. 179-J 7C1 HS]|uniref:hypothetical protein n=1 Tax=Ornithinibacillus sp. 179-J 7C1 HS TaxID=3142384 RepID=UPI0039A2EA31